MIETQKTIVKQEIWHSSYNLDKKDNLKLLPDEKAVFGIFAIVNGEPINCRYVGETDNLQESIRELYENPPSEGMKKFMQGAWIQMLMFETLPESTSEQRKQFVKEWESEHSPKIDDDGEYPGYYDY